MIRNIILLAAAMALVTGAEAEDGVGSISESGQVAQDAQALVFVPPLRGAPTRRVGGATRGTDDAAPFFAVLAPETTGLTSRASPTFYWYLSADSDQRFVFTLNSENQIDPVVEFDLAGPMSKGVVEVSLAAWNIELSPEVTYEWSVALIFDPTQRSNDVITSATLQRKSFDSALIKEFQAVNRSTRLARLAQHGYWYDAMELIDEAISGRSNVQMWRDYRAQLLEQVGLPLTDIGGMS